MPRKPKKPCKHPGCPNLTDGDYCSEHSRLYVQDRSIYNSKWSKARKIFLKAHPFCVRCKAEERLVKATVVDHIVPHRGDETLFWDEGNWQPLCKKCHDKKTMTEDRYINYKY